MVFFCDQRPRGQETANFRFIETYGCKINLIMSFSLLTESVATSRKRLHPSKNVNADTKTIVADSYIFICAFFLHFFKILCDMQGPPPDDNEDEPRFKKGHQEVSCV